MKLREECREIALVILDSCVQALDLRAAALLVVAQLLGQELSARLPAPLALRRDALGLGLHPVTDGRDVGFRSLAQLLGPFGCSLTQPLDRFVHRLTQG